MSRKLRCGSGAFVYAGVALWVVGCDVAPIGEGKGNLRVLVTDKPFPIEFMEEALVTITRVEVRRAGDEGSTDGCMDDATCDDRLVCNGSEVCNPDTGVCDPGAPPECADGEVCDELRDGCATPCGNPSECDDGVFCNGAEGCDDDTGLCQAGTPVECPEGQRCAEETQECVPDEGDDEEDADGDDGDNDGPFVVIFDSQDTGEPQTFNLLDLQGGKTALLADAEIPAGAYTQMRVFVTEGVVRLTGCGDGESEFVLQVPSGAQSGIKLNFDFEVAGDQTTTLILDIDLSRAFTPIPGGRIDDPCTIREFKFSPSIAMRLINLVDAGGISGTVTTGEGDETLPLEAVSVTVFDENGDDVTSTATDEAGSYVVLGLVPGEYSLEFSAAGFEDEQVPGVVVDAGVTTEGVDVVMTPTESAPEP